MAKTTAPLLSIGARGQIGKTQVYASWRGVSYARQRVVPANPNSAAQQSTRGVFSAMSALWKNGPTLMIAAFNAAAAGRPLTGRNIMIGENTREMRGETDRQKFIGSPGAKGGPAAVSVAADQVSPGDPIDVTITAPPTPTGWTLDAAVAMAFIDGDAADPVPFPILAGENTSPTAGGGSEVELDGFEASDEIVVVGWLRWSKPDGTTAYGASQAVPYTVT